MLDQLGLTASNYERLVQVTVDHKDYKCKLHTTVLELNSLSKRCKELETTLADASSRLTAKNGEIKKLDQLLQDRDAEIDRLVKIIEDLKRESKTIVTFDDSDEWRLRFNELQNRARRDVDNYENELLRKDQVLDIDRDHLGVKRPDQPTSQPASSSHDSACDSRETIHR